jgi:hypothetical protein
MKTPRTTLMLLAILATICCTAVRLYSIPSYFVYLYDAAGNRVERIYVKEHIHKRSVEAIPFNAEIIISPNPAVDYFKIKITGINSFKKTRLELYDLQGKLLEVKNNVNEETTFSFKDKNSGAYYISVTLDNSERKFKIIRIN